MKISEHNYSIMNSPLTLMEAYKIAIQIRDFEIQLFWKRSLFFAGFIAIIFAAYTNEKVDNQFLRSILVSLGLLFALAWTLVNRGSKYWYESWESKISALEKELGTNLVSYWSKPQNKFFLYKSRLYSVSKIAIFISDLVTLSWLLLFIYHLQNMQKNSCILVLCFFVIIQICLLLFGTKTSVPNQIKEQWSNES